ncbi:hypothetical protein [Agaribacterium haliotis]|uniref:hypothetical protein n=1 Tax=Agaribacterium haliotis TaxID=2013869 RepID=UPI000BB52EE6|nr:hypothetical protein [Agaribacterium haliotis]
MPNWLLDRLFEVKDQPKPTFAIQGTINWMRALAEITNSDEFSDDKIKLVFNKVQRRAQNELADTVVFENMLMAYHNFASLNAFDADVAHKYDICRSAIICWYYATYFSASAMVAASSGSKQETHTATAKAWHADFAEKQLLVYPFNLYLSTLVKKDVDKKISELRNDNKIDLNTYAKSLEEAKGACISYLSGTADYRKWEVEERIKASRQFKELKVDNFRTKAARELRDNELERGQVNFLFQAFRYRGKANYRDSIFLSYGNSYEEKMDQFIKDLKTVTEGFIRMASIYCQKRVAKGDWELFVNDLKENTRLSLGAEVFKI